MSLQCSSVRVTTPTRYLHIGPGGRKCSCCFPGPRHKDKEYRKAKLRSDRDFKRQLDKGFFDN